MKFIMESGDMLACGALTHARYDGVEKCGSRRSTQDKRESQSGSLVLKVAFTNGMWMRKEPGTDNAFAITV